MSKKYINVKDLLLPFKSFFFLPKIEQLICSFLLFSTLWQAILHSCKSKGNARVMQSQARIMHVLARVVQQFIKVEVSYEIFSLAKS